MRPLLLGPLLIATALAAPAAHTDIVAKLVSDLLPLKLAVASDEPLKDDVYMFAELRSLETYSQSQAMNPFTTDLAEFRFKLMRNGPKPDYRGNVLRPFIGPDQAYKLGYVLTGKDLSETNVRPVVHALLSILESVEVCREEGSSVGDSSEFRTAAEKARSALQALGVRNHDVRIVMDSLFRGAIRATSPAPGIKYQ